MANVIELQIRGDSSKAEAEVKSLARTVDRASKDIAQDGKKARLAWRNMTPALDKVKSSVLSLKTAFFGLAGAYGIKQLVTSSLEAADAIGKTADKLGIGIDALQEYRFAASQSGVATETLDMALQRFVRRVGEAAQGKGELKDTLEKYNIAVRDASGRTRDANAVLNDLADVIRGTNSDAERLRIAFKAFDSEGAALVNMLRGGSEGLNKFRQEANDLGIVMSEQMIRNAEHANDQLDKLRRVLGTQLTMAVAAMAPMIASLADSFVKLATAASKTWQSLRDVAGKDTGAVFRTSIQALEMQIRANEEALAKMEKDPSIWDKIIYFGNTKEELRAKLADLRAELETNKKSYQKYLQEMEQAARPMPTTPEIPILPAPDTKSVKKAKDAWDELTTARAQAYQEWYDEQVAAREAINNEQVKLTQSTKKQFDEMSESAKDTAEGMSSTFSGLFFDVMQGEFEGLGGLADRILSSLQSKAADILGQLAGQALGGIFGKGGGIGDFFASLFHSGGVAGVSAMPRRSVSPWVFAGAPRLHNGLRSDEMPAILQKGERVVPKKQAGEAVNVTFNISTPDISSFRASQGQILTDAALAMRRARRNL